MATIVEPPMPGLADNEMPVDLTSDMFFEMIEAGLFPPERRVFLWGGRLCEKMAKTVAHAFTAYTIAEALRPHLAPDWLIWPENPIALDARHAPLPDVTVIRGPAVNYARERRHPRTDDVGLIVEVAVSSLAKDLGERAEKFARALVPNYWVADVRNRRIVAHAGPEIIDGLGRYSRIGEHGLTEDISLVLDGREVARLPVAELLTGMGI
jgi:Uma2 family endonuclease